MSQLFLDPLFLRHQLDTTQRTLILYTSVIKTKDVSGHRFFCKVHVIFVQF